MASRIRGFKEFTVAVVLLALLSACSSSPERYRVATIGNANRSITAEVLSAAPVTIIESTSGAGATTGGLMGAAATSDSDNAGVIIAGILAGAIIGDAIEAEGKKHNGMEYVIETANGRLMTVAQINMGSDLFEAGDAVILVYGYPTRLLADPRL